MQVETIKRKSSNYIMVRVSEEEALEIIESLSRQLRSKNPNNERPEHVTSDGSYFSIAVWG